MKTPFLIDNDTPHTCDSNTEGHDRVAIIACGPTIKRDGYNSIRAVVLKWAGGAQPYSVHTQGFTVTHDSREVDRYYFANGHYFSSLERAMDLFIQFIAASSQRDIYTDIDELEAQEGLKA